VKTFALYVNGSRYPTNRSAVALGSRTCYLLNKMSEQSETIDAINHLDNQGCLTRQGLPSIHPPWKLKEERDVKLRVWLNSSRRSLTSQRIPESLSHRSSDPPHSIRSLLIHSLRTLHRLLHFGILARRRGGCGSEAWKESEAETEDGWHDGRASEPAWERDRR